MKINVLTKDSRVIYIVQDGKNLIDLFSAPQEDEEMKNLCKQRADELVKFGAVIRN